MLRVLDLFSGIGGFSLGLRRTGGFRTVAFCEINPVCRKVLRKHWPDVPIYEDVKELTAAQLRRDGVVADVITGGFPCQDISTTGKRRGITGARSGLWSELCRIIGEVRPQYAIVENVPNLLVGPSEQCGGWFGRVLGDLAEIRLDAEWHIIPALTVGARHVRERVWIIAYPQGDAIKGSIFEGVPRQRLLEGQLGGGSWRPVPGTYWAAPQPGIVELDDGVPGWVGEVSGYGNAVVPQIPEMIGHAILESGLCTE